MIDSKAAGWMSAGIGSALLALIALFLLAAPGSPLVSLFKLGIAVVLSLGLIGVGYWHLTDGKAAKGSSNLVPLWIVIGILAMTVLNVWFRIVTALFGAVEWQAATLSTLAAGGFGGALIGIYSARSRRQQAERNRALADYEEIFEKADVGIALNDPEAGTVGRINPSYADMLGYDPAELVGTPIGEISGDDPDFDQERAGTLMAKAMAGEPQQFDWLLKRKDGSQFWAEVSLKHATIGESPRLLAFVRDISDRRRWEQELEKFQEIYEKADHAIGLTDPETGTIVGANPKYAEILGYELDELEGLRIEEVSADSQEFSQEKAMEVVRDAMAGEPQSIDWLLERKDGSTVWVAVSLKRARIGDEERLLVFFRDVSERKEREKELDRHRSEMEFFNSLLRHDVLNGITVIRTHGGRLADTLDGEQREHAETIVEWADNTTGVVNRVRDVLETLTGDAEPDLEPVDLSKTIRDEIDRLRSAYPDVTFETDLDGEVAVVANDLLEDVVGNVLRNALDHNDTDDLTVSATLEATPATVTVRIADDGSGIPEEDREAVFRRGETGHVKKTGSGFGLYFVDAMVSTYGGDVWVEDNEPSGSEFVIELSAA